MKVQGITNHTEQKNGVGRDTDIQFATLGKVAVVWFI